MRAWKGRRVFLSVLASCLVLYPLVCAGEASRSLIDAAKTGKLSAVERALKQGADIEATDKEYGSTALIWATYGGHRRIVELLLQKGANPNAANIEGRTSLFFAANKGNERIVKILLEVGADPSVQDKAGKRAVDFARSKGHRRIVDLLEQPGENKPPEKAAEKAEKTDGETSADKPCILLQDYLNEAMTLLKESRGNYSGDLDKKLVALRRKYQDTQEIPFSKLMLAIKLINLEKRKVVYLETRLRLIYDIGETQLKIFRLCPTVKFPK